MYTKPDPLEKFYGKTIDNFVYDKDHLEFLFSDGEVLTGTAWGDCCSVTWLESIDLPGVISGTLMKIEDIQMPTPEYDEKAYDCLEFYGIRITTTNGIAIVDYRNESNGYYGGYIRWTNRGTRL